MCLVIKEGERIKKAESDILCFKSVRTLDDDDTKWTCIYYSFADYDFNTEVAAERVSVSNSDGCVVRYLEKIEHLTVIKGTFADGIYEGFHARTIKILDTDKYCIIPKGTEICYGNLNDIVTVSMIVFKNKRQYRRYQIKKLFERIFPYYLKTITNK